MVIRSRARIQTALERFLTETCVIEEQMVTTDRYGGMALAGRVVASGVRCRVITETRMSGTDTREVGSAEALIERMKLVVPAGTALGANQRVTVNGAVYQIVSVLVTHTDAVDAQAVIVRVYD